MKTTLRLACVCSGLMMSAALLAVGCSDDSKPKASSNTEAGADDGVAGSDDAGNVGGAGSNEAMGGASTGNTGNSDTGARPNVDPGDTEHPDPNDPNQPGAGGSPSGPDSPDFDGVSLTGLKGIPAGCDGGFDALSGKLTITLGEAGPVVRIAVHAGVITANGKACASVKSEPAKADAVKTLEILGGDGDEVLYLDLSDEAFSACLTDDGSITIDLGAGNDSVTLIGTRDSDVFHAGTDAEKLVIDLDDDKRVDLVLSGKPAVVISTGAKVDEVRADGEDLEVMPAAIPLTIYGGGASDRLAGGAASDRLFGGIGHDWFDAGAETSGGDVFDGGDGLDTVDFSARSAELVISVGSGANDGEADENADVGASIENLYGGQGKNDITGGVGANSIWGGPEADKLSGGDGDDLLNGGGGDDVLNGGKGDDRLYGDDGDDDLSGAEGDDLLDGAKGANILSGGAGDGDICFVSKADKATGCEL